VADDAVVVVAVVAVVGVLLAAAFAFFPVADDAAAPGCKFADAFACPCTRL
jgi:hypothetical protein